VRYVYPRWLWLLTDIKLIERNVTDTLRGETAYVINTPINLEECVLVCDGCVRESVGRGLYIHLTDLRLGGAPFWFNRINTARWPESYVSPVIRGGCNMSYNSPLA